eukprot:s4088_g7.t1
MSRTAVDGSTLGKHASQRRLLVAKILTQDDMRHRSLLLFRMMIESNHRATDLGLQLAFCKSNSQDELYGSTLEDTFASKSSATLYKRSRSMWQYFIWLKSVRKLQGIEFTEELVYGYLVQAKKDGKAPTHGSAFVQCLNFVHATCTMTSFNPSHLSGRIKGATKSMLENKRPLQQARALYRGEVQALEDYALDIKSHPRVRIIAGYLLFCLMACCRFSDPMYASDWQISESGSIVLIEAKTRVHKTAHVHNRQTGSTLTTHGLKATLLTWVTISNTLSFDQRRALGHHVDPGSKAPFTYSRDNAVNLQVPIALMFKRLASGSFDPDLPRAAQVDMQLTDLLREVGAHDAAFVVGPQNVVVDTDIWSDCTDVDNANDIEDDAEVADMDEVNTDADKAAGLVTQHKASRVLHFVSTPSKLVCGRQYSSAYCLLEEDLVVKWPFCRQCRKSGGEDLVAQVCQET